MRFSKTALAETQADRSPDWQTCTVIARCLRRRPPEGVYKAAPRDGVWATPPFMHNGSVPNLYEMLIPAAERTKKFYLGGDFDPVKVGLDTTATSGTFLMDTTLLGQLERRSLLRGWSARQRHYRPVADRRSALGARRVSEIHSRERPAASRRSAVRPRATFPSLIFDRGEAVIVPIAPWQFAEPKTNDQAERAMSDHIDGPRQIGDPSADLTDLFAFTSPENPARTVLAANVFPTCGVDAIFSNAINHSIVVRRAKVAGIGDATKFETSDPEIRFSFRFDALERGAADQKPDPARHLHLAGWADASFPRQ